MKGKVHFLSVVISLVLTGLFLVPALGQAKEDSWGEMHKMRRATLVKELKLSPEKAKDFNAVEDKVCQGAPGTHREAEERPSRAADCCGRRHPR